MSINDGKEAGFPGRGDVVRERSGTCEISQVIRKLIHFSRGRTSNQNSLGGAWSWPPPQALERLGGHRASPASEAYLAPTSFALPPRLV